MESALISASVAIILFIGTQIVQERHRRTQFLEVKLEEYFRCLHSIMEHTRYPILEEGSTFGDLARAFQQEAGDLARSLAEPHMFAHLYFPDTIPRFERLGKCVRSYNHWMHDYADVNLPYEIETGQKLFQEMNSLLNEIKQYLVSERRTLTEAMFNSWN